MRIGLHKRGPAPHQVPGQQSRGDPIGRGAEELDLKV